MGRLLIFYNTTIHLLWSHTSSGRRAVLSGEDVTLFSNLGLKPLSSALADLKPKKSLKDFWEIFIIFVYV
jgi:hypothetical protein